MRSEKEIRKQLELVYEHRLNIRIDRYMKRLCRNCVSGINREFDLGDFGTLSRWECKDGKCCNDECGFRCRYTVQDIENKMISEISDPSVCGSKEPKIAMLMWVLVNGKNPSEKTDSSSQSCEKNDDNRLSLWDRLRGLWK